MTKKQLAEQIAVKAEITEVLARRIVQITLDCMTSALVKGETLEFRDFGMLKTKIRKARKGRNPRVGTVVQVPERKAIVWKMGKGLKEKIRVTACNA